ncbi:hypothetical protein ALC57_06477, partial [Trachymyrmex cornetzi]
KPRIFRPRMNYLELFDDANFSRKFVISKRSFNMLLEKIYVKIQHNTDRNNIIPPIIQLMVTLRFYAIGSFLMIVGDFCGIIVATAILHNIAQQEIIPAAINP